MKPSEQHRIFRIRVHRDFYSGIMKSVFYSQPLPSDFLMFILPFSSPLGMSQYFQKTIHSVSSISFMTDISTLKASLCTHRRVYFSPHESLCTNWHWISSAILMLYNSVPEDLPVAPHGWLWSWLSWMLCVTCKLWHSSACPFWGQLGAGETAEVPAQTLPLLWIWPPLFCSSVRRRLGFCRGSAEACSVHGDNKRESGTHSV